MTFVAKKICLGVAISFCFFQCHTNQQRTTAQVQRELFDERCGTRWCKESKKDGYYRYSGYPEYYYKEKELPRLYRYRSGMYYTSIPQTPNSSVYPFRQPGYGR